MAEAVVGVMAVVVLLLHVLPAVMDALVGVLLLPLPTMVATAWALSEAVAWVPPWPSSLPPTPPGLIP